MKRKIEKKLFHLMMGEFAALCTFAFLWLYYIPKMVSFYPFGLSFFPFLLLEFILLQGSLYWYIKWSRVRQSGDSKLKNRERYLFMWLKRLNILLLFIGGGLYIRQPGFLYSGIYIFAIIEYINYYHIRLSYMNKKELNDFIQQKGLRKSILARELHSICLKRD